VKPFDLLEDPAEHAVANRPDVVNHAGPEAVRLGEDAIEVACGWCGMYTPIGPACFTCGSPLNLHRPCSYCGQLRIALCPSCHVSLETLGALEPRQ
jgi:hypothetical protein